MDEATTREHIQNHADAVVRGELDAVATDLSEEVRAQLPQIAQALPQPVTKAELPSVEIGDPASVAIIRCSGSSGGVTIRSNWHVQDGRPVIVHAEPAS